MDAYTHPVDAGEDIGVAADRSYWPTVYQYPDTFDDVVFLDQLHVDVYQGEMFHEVMK